MDNKQKGRFGEKKAMTYLINRGYTIVDINYFCRYGEIDIIAKKAGVFIFVEVKTRSSNAYGSPAEAVSFIKQKRMIQSVQDYVQRNKMENYPLQLDVIEVFLLEGHAFRINHIKNAFEGIGI
ncbi:MAG: YraN family protein [Eubacteriales bacterium]